MMELTETGETAQEQKGASAYRPTTDVWILARAKAKYYGAYPAGFLWRARAQLGVRPSDAVLHVCAGAIRQYQQPGLGPNDRTVDLDPETRPDYVMDVRDGLPDATAAGLGIAAWPAILIDRPYTLGDAGRYRPGSDSLPKLNPLVRRCLQAVPTGHRVGVLDYQWPHPGKLGREVFVAGVGTGRNGRARWFVVFERV